MQAAYQQGIAAGQAAAAQAAQARLDPALGALADIVNELAGCRRILRAQAEGATVALAMAIARRVLHRELNIDPTAILGLVKAAFERCDASETHRLRVSPSDARIIQENRSRLEFPQALEVMPDPALVSGSAIFETSRGELDASIDTQLSEIERGLTDVLRRRSS
jgi:flagellar assembly protein FliH